MQLLPFKDLNMRQQLAFLYCCFEDVIQFQTSSADLKTAVNNRLVVAIDEKSEKMCLMFFSGLWLF